MRILQVCQRPQRRGAEIFAAQLSTELRDQGHEVVTVYLYPHEGVGRLLLGAEDRVLEGDVNHPLETLIGFRPALLRRLLRLMASFRPDITQVNGARSVKYGVLARALNRAAGGAIVYRNIGSYSDWVRGARRKTFYRMILRRVDGVVAISQASRAALEPVFSHRTHKTVISNAVDPDSLRPKVGRQELRQSCDTPPDVPVAVFVGSLSSEKRVDRLIDALHTVRSDGSDLRLWIVGEGPLRGDHERHVRELGLAEAVVFFGSRDDVASYMTAADLLALVSDTEGVPAVLLEAACVGLPVVATNVGGIPECVVDEETGLLVSPGDDAALVHALQRLGGDEGLRRRVGSAARERVLRRHSIGRIAEEYVAFYERVLAQRTGGGRASDAGPLVTERDQHPFSGEMGLVAVLARAELEPEHEKRARDLLSAGVDWDAFVALSRRHRLSPLVSQHLRRFRDIVPPEIDRMLVRDEFANASGILERTGQLLQVLDSLRDRDITAVPYKGPALGAQLYGSGALRMAGDVDIVIRPRDVVVAREALAGLGYRPTVPLDAPGVEFMTRHRYHEGFARDDGGNVELHWRFTNREVPFDIDLDQAWTRLRTVDLNGRQVPTFHPEDLILILSVHGAKHRWDRLEWLAGLSQLVRDSDDIDWDALIVRASSLGVRRILYLGLQLGAELLDAPVPPDVLRRIRSDRHMAALVAHVMHLLERPPAGWDLPDRLDRDRFRILLQERARDRIRFVWHRATTPSDPNRWEIARIGGWAVPVHALRRPFHAAGQLVIALRALASHRAP
jgi:glycosyltransferase involved in cell wall biosynthesis